MVLTLIILILGLLFLSFQFKQVDLGVFLIGSLLLLLSGLGLLTSQFSFNETEVEEYSYSTQNNETVISSIETTTKPTSTQFDKGIGVLLILLSIYFFINASLSHKEQV